jgi:dTDP-4-dehydrorhamnose 3,5-epimerase
VDPPVKVIPTELREVLLLEPKIHEDARGLTYESYNQRVFREATGVEIKFVQENRSRSAKHTIRGLHYQLGHAQGKLIGVLSGELFDVAIDLRKSSPTFGKWAGFHLSGREHRYAWIPAGFGHGFLALSEGVEVIYKLTDFWDPTHERVIRWDDPDIAIRWPFPGKPLLSKRDAAAPHLKDAEVFP